MFAALLALSLLVVHSKVGFSFYTAITGQSSTIELLLPTWGIIKLNILIPLGVLGQHTSHSLKCIRITLGIIKT